MKSIAYTLILAVFLWSGSFSIWLPLACADVSIGTSTVVTSSTKTQTFRSVMPTATNTDVTQKQNQIDTNNLNKQGQQQSSSLGMAAIAAGMAMIMAGMAMLSNPQTAAMGAALIAAGSALVASGMAALAAAGKMGDNANTAGGNSLALEPIPTAPVPINPTITGGGTPGGGIKIDPNLSRTGKVGEILDDFEKKTGASRDDLINGLNAGKSPAEILGGNNKLGKSAGDIQSALDKYGANTPPLGSDEVMNKLGLTPEDLGNTLNLAGGGERKPNSAAGVADFDSLFGAKPLADPALNGGQIGQMKVSKDVQDALDRNGITSRTIFDMVHSQYEKKVPMLFGVRKEAAAPSSRPLFDLHSGGGTEF